MRVEYQVVAAFGLDLLLGDPRWLPHPVRGIGWLAQQAERVCCARVSSQRMAGVLTAGIVVAVAAGATRGLTALAHLISPTGADAVGIVIISTTIATRDLTDHALRVYRALSQGDLPGARAAVGMIVGRDTANLDEPEVARAAVESVAESIVDGITGALFFAFVAGPVGAMTYRAINTLDSMFGHKDDQYIEFGWASARLDDVANWLPARVTLPVMWCAAAILWSRPADAVRIALRDARKHASPNAGLSEAAMAGALAVQLGGLNYYQGEPLPTPRMGDPGETLSKVHILRGIRIMVVTSLLFVLVGMAIMLCIKH
jgi:adenosylcobinamide-phosphate synthase